MMTLDEVYSLYQRVPQFLGETIVDVNQRGTMGDTLLHLAAEGGNVEHINVLIDAGADLEARGDREFTPLHGAILRTRLDAVRRLVELGADVRARIDDGIDGVTLARDMLTALIRNEPSNRPRQEEARRIICLLETVAAAASPRRRSRRRRGRGKRSN